MENCIFCKIINHQIPSSIIYEDQDVIAFLDISQSTKGHTLVLPKKHYKNLLEIDDMILSKLIIVTKKIANSMMKSLHAEGFNLINNCNEIAGQSVNHFHIHIIPRYNKDEFIIESRNSTKESNLKLIQEQIKNGLAK